MVSSLWHASSCIIMRHHASPSLCLLARSILLNLQVDGIAVVSSFVIAPYTSFWQPDQPTYNPVEACFQLTHPDVNQGKPYYESPRFRVRASMTVSGDIYPLRIWCPYDRVSVCLSMQL